MANILVFTEFTDKGSGYSYLMSPILDELGKHGHTIKMVGLSYSGFEYDYEFSVTPSHSVQEGIAVVQNVLKLWNPDVLICALDIPLQLQIFENVRTYSKVKYIAVTPLENPPLTQSWAAGLMLMDWVFFISDLGVRAAHEAGLRNVSHLPGVVDSVSNSVNDKAQLRKILGFKEDEFVIFTVADNQERKNLWASLDIIRRLKERGKNVKYVLVTRENSPVGWKLRDLCTDMDINTNVLILERGITKDEMEKIYMASDLYLATSKAEGLCLPVLDAMALGLPVVATKTGALIELLEGGRGHLVQPEYSFIDPWGNSRRDMIDRELAVETICGIIQNGTNVIEMASKYIMGRNDINVPVSQLDYRISEVMKNEK